MTTLASEDQHQLLAIARESIVNGITRGQPVAVEPAEFSSALQKIQASFVTLLEQGQLRGCIGSLAASRTLIEDVADNAFSAAFRDPRFNPLQAAELDDLLIEISVLNPATAMQFSSESDLIGQLRPGIDGLILEEGNLRATFLPTVWESLGEPEQFLSHLKQKAGLPASYWSDSIKVSRYTTFSFQEQE